MKEDIRNALSDGIAKTARELNDIIQPENIQRLHEALSAMKKSGEVENGEDRQPGEPGGLIGKAAKPIKTYRLADADMTGKPVKRAASSGMAAWDGDAITQLVKQVKKACAPITDVVETFDVIEGAGSSRMLSDHANEWAPDAARSAPSIDEIEMTERYRDAENTDEDGIAILIHRHEELMLTYADRLAGNDPVWALMRQQYQAMLEL